MMRNDTMNKSAEVLLVDDDPDLLKLISLRLTSANYRVRTADSGETALAALAVARPAAVITDMRMPGMRRSVMTVAGRAMAMAASAVSPLSAVRTL